MSIFVGVPEQAPSQHGRQNCKRVEIFDGVSPIRISSDSSACKCGSPVTLVTSFYDIGDRSKHSQWQMSAWTERFFSLTDNMVVYTDSGTLEKIKRVREHSLGCTIIFIQPLFRTEIGKSVNWTQQKTLDPEASIHSEELYIIWNQKMLWLAEVAESNPYGSLQFFWADAGQFRDDYFFDTHILAGESWVSSVAFLPICRFAFLSIQPFTRTEVTLTADGTSLPLDSILVRLGGGNFGGDACAIIKMRQKFLRMLFRYVEAGVFAGKDQPLYGSICIENRDLCFLISGDDIKESRDIWFAMQPVLHGIIDPVPQYHVPVK